MNIYALTDPRSQEIRYVGITRFDIDTRLKRHLISSKSERNHRAHWISQLVSLGMIPEIQLLERVKEEYAEEAERYWIAKKRAEGFRLTNSTDGGGGVVGFHFSQASREKMSENRRGKPKSDAWKLSAKQSWNSGTRKPRRDSRAKSSVSHKLAWASMSDEQRNESIAQLRSVSVKRGDRLSDDWRKAISAGLKGKPKSEAHRLAISISRLSKRKDLAQ